MFIGQMVLYAVIGHAAVLYSLPLALGALVVMQVACALMALFDRGPYR